MAKVKLLTPEQRYDEGKALRTKCPRNAHGKTILGQGPKRDPVSIIEETNAGRIENLVPIRHGRMMQSPFAFFRGTAAIQAHDLAGTPSSGIWVQACGDCHLANFGGFATPGRNIVFDVNDFDETLPAPFEWDLKRLAASFVVASRDRGFRADQAREAAVEVVSAYRNSMRKRSGTGVLEAWYSRITVEDVHALVKGEKALAHRVKKRTADARTQTHEVMLNKLTTPKRGLPRIVDEPPLLYHQPGMVNSRPVLDTFKAYRETLLEERRVLFDRFKFVNIAMKVVGVGSVGTRCYVALFLAAPDDPLFLQVKEARRSVLAPYTGRPQVKRNGHRIVIGQRLMQGASDIFLGWARAKNTGREFYFRQLRDMKIGPLIELFTPREMKLYATLCGLALARAQDKAGDAARIAGYLGRNDDFVEAMADYAVGYADQVARDYDAFARAARSGRVKTDLNEGELGTMLR